VKTEHDHAETAWQCFLSGGPVALLPLADGRSSLVWSCPDELAAELLAMDDAAFAERLGAAVDHVLGNLEVMTPRLSFPLGSGYAPHYSGRRYALIGDAAHRVHPLAGQGVNLGLLDAACLVDELSQHMGLPVADPGDPRVLRRYERGRKGDNLLTLGTMDVLNRLFGGPAADIAGFALGVIDRSGPLKSSLARYAMKHGG
jgi:ubiquinone biosynthesis UbiH/UbiF/VisC/COQ6 family hydroxylase